jgi:vitamin K-dependent gamma-carboxylase
VKKKKSVLLIAAMSLRRGKKAAAGTSGIESSSETEEKNEKNVKSSSSTTTELPLSVRVVQSLWSEVPAHSIVALRIAWGVVMLYEMTTYMHNDYYKANRYLVAPEYQFRYWAFEWVPRLTLAEWQIFFPIMCALSVCFAVGLFYRVASVAFFLGFCCIYFQDIGLYLNHFYLIVVLNFVYCFLPANRFFALDALIGLAPASPTVPYWSVWLSRFLISNVYCWAGVAKMNEDWIRCEPLIDWIPSAHVFPPLRWFGLEWVQKTTEMACFMSWSGLLLDSFVPFFLSYRPTRMLAFMATMAFHVTNKFMLNIGVFPYVMIGISFIYFDPDWPLEPLRWYRAFRKTLDAEKSDGQASTTTPTSTTTTPPTPTPTPAPAPTPTPPILAYNPKAKTLGGVLRSLSSGNKAVVVFLILVLLQQVLFPLRHLYYPGDVVWNEEGHRYSWRMKLRDKSGFVQFYVKSSVTNETVVFDPVLDTPFRTLTKKQSKKVPGRPDMIHLFAHHLAEMFERNEGKRPEVRVLAIVSVNNRIPQLFVDPFVNLAAIEPWTWPNKWIVDFLPRGEFDWRVVPWPVCEHLPHGPKSRYSRPRMYEMYKGFTIEHAQASYKRLPPTEADAYRVCRAKGGSKKPAREPVDDGE